MRKQLATAFILALSINCMTFGVKAAQAETVRNDSALLPQYHPIDDCSYTLHHPGAPIACDIYIDQDGSPDCHICYEVETGDITEDTCE